MTQSTEMGVSQYPDSINPPDLQIWNNGESATRLKASWSLLQFGNRSDSIESDTSKENLIPNVLQPSVPMKHPVPLTPPHSIGNSHGKPLKLLPERSLFEPVSSSNNGKGELGVRDERKIDSEIEEIENELSRLSAKLESLRMEKIERTVKSTVERRGRVVPAKFMEQKNIVRNSEPQSGQSKLNRRGFSVGPAEIEAWSRQMGKPEMTPVQPIQNRRKSCVWKLQEIGEKKIRTERGQSPKSRKTVSKVQAVTTLGSRKLSKKEESVLAAIQPKKLFRDGDKSVTAKKPAKIGRVVPSRYSQIQSNSVVSERKRSLPDDGNEDNKRSDKRHASLVGKSWGSELRPKKKWEIPSDLVVYKGVGENLTVSKPSVAAKVVDMLPRIRTNNLCVNDSLRDSGAAKRVAELMGRRFVFCPEEEEEEASVCQALNFAEEDCMEHMSLE